MFCLDLPLILIRYYIQRDIVVLTLIFAFASPPLTVKKLLSHLQTVSCLLVSSRYGMSFIVSGDRLISSNSLGKSFIEMLNKIVLSKSNCFRPIIVRKVWLILSWCIRDTFRDLYIDLIISNIFPVNTISSNLYNRRFWHIES